MLPDFDNNLSITKICYTLLTKKIKNIMKLFKNLFSKPLSTKLTVTSSNGFHLRPVAKFSALAKSFKCDVSALFNGKSVDAKKVNTLLSLSLEKQDTFTLTTQGKEAQKALESLQTLFGRLMKEDMEIRETTKETTTYKGKILEGNIIAKGIAIAPAIAYQTQTVTHDNKLTFDKALTKTLDDLEATYMSHKNGTDAEIYLAQKELLLALNETCNSLESLETQITQESNKLKNTKLSAKIADYQDILKQVKTHLGVEIKLLFPEHPFILLANDLLPSEIALLEETKVQGVVLKETAANSHTAILLRASGITSLIADTSQIPLAKEVILDSFAGVAVLSPHETDKKKAQQLQKQYNAKKAHSASKRFDKAVTTQGQHIKIFANVGDVPSAKLAKEEGAEGIGLLRSEFLFKSVKPTLQAQTNAFREIFDNFDDITVRTLDVGGDKALPYINIPLESNPFLGVRGVRLFRTHPEIMEEQLHAVFLASKGKKIKIMFPMVSSVEEFTKAKSFAQNVAQKYNIDISNIDFGIMIEVPSVLFLIEAFNEVVDFYSIGTNDLTQYLFAVERTHPLLKVDELSPVVFSALKTVITKATKPVSICGELASNTKAIDKLINLGITILSVSPKRIAQTKETIRHV
ncbi:Phosphoenolpyruvate-protein phosphotransferase of PTS system / Fructose-specific phosphocarrier protein HPr / PTS system, fructose-specific IIA component [hydrothermal vent metagenome]|uniref:Phosphoenolpyruvate-protein phosphotransferase of PTS system / Fructose-specific phosphocarrier protein HPr / PTS system, fructose-specific IIA component n=1 Tax=hydrothermal vent metagenome TaxID=652676 RepID=A0A1W1BZS4_9ZZZZ